MGNNAGLFEYTDSKPKGGTSPCQGQHWYTRSQIGAK